MESAAKINVIETHRTDKYQDKVVDTYDDPPEMWQKALGDNLSFQFGLFDQAEIAEGARPGSIGPAEFRAFDHQLELAGLLGPSRPQLRRILDIGCGWGFITKHIAALFTECQCIDAINISQRQLDFCANNLPMDLRKRVNLYFCNGQDVDLLPDSAVPYDLVVVRGVYTHFPFDVFEASVAQVAQRLSPRGTLLISDTLYRVTDIETYKSPIPDTVDRLACAHRKTPDYFISVLKQNGLHLHDLRILPSNAEVIHWFDKVRLNIEQNFPDGASGPIQELHDMAVSFNQSLAKEKASVYSIIARHVVV
ncbi:Methyltransferase type 12 [Penicillium camemberti]|uniref:Methyltransferase type 12 n=1 Tax=Penicillium camemberti (strain FM 013) TaxID=1429867 RepID=A0A0G4PVL6_PENC3|nr:Methyltransferase type 12 [Penicillium camemberti]